MHHFITGLTKGKNEIQRVGITEELNQIRDRS